MSEQDPSEKFFQTEPKLPDLYVMWLELAQIAHKLEPFARGDRSPAAVNQAREARENIRIARQELTETELFIAVQIRGVDDQREQALSDWEQEVDRPDLEPEPILQWQETPGQFPVEFAPLEGEYIQPELLVPKGPVAELGPDAPEPHWPETDLPTQEPQTHWAQAGTPEHVQPTPEVQRDWKARRAGLVDPIVYRDSSGQPRANTDALVGHVRRMTDPNDVDCYNCGHPKGAHGDQGAGIGCGVIVEHGYPCDCPQYAEGKARPVAEMHGRPINAREFNDVLDEMDNTQTGEVTVRQAEQAARNYFQGAQTEPDLPREPDTSWIRTQRADGKPDRREQD